MITLEKVKETAKLAALAFNDNELSVLHKELTCILEWVAMLDTVHTENIPHLISTEHIALHEDEITEGGNAEAVLKNAPATLHGCYFSVPKMIEGA